MPATKHIRDAIRAREAGDRKILYWSELGQVACPVHMPFPGSDTWLSGRWMLMAWSDRQNWKTQTGRPPKCETCG